MLIPIIAVALILGTGGESPDLRKSAEVVSPGEKVVFDVNGSAEALEGKTLRFEDWGGALIWRAEFERNLTFVVPYNARPGRYEVELEGSGETLANFTVENERWNSFPWAETDASVLETYVYPEAMGVGLGDKWRTGSRLNRMASGQVEGASSREEAFKALVNFSGSAVANPSGHTLSQILSPTRQVRLIERRGRSQGDCTEAAVLLISMSRSVGIPSRYVMDGGLEPYGGDDDPGLKGHAWVEAYIDGEWVMADPSRRGNLGPAVYDSPEVIGSGNMVTIPAAYVATGEEYLLESPVRNGWISGEKPAERYLSEGGVMVAHVANLSGDAGPYYDVKFSWGNKGTKLVFQSSVEASPRVYASKASVSDGRYLLRVGAGGWTELARSDFEPLEN